MVYETIAHPLSMNNATNRLRGTSRVTKRGAWAKCNDIFGRCDSCGHTTILGVCPKCGFCHACSSCGKVRLPSGKYYDTAYDRKERASHGVCMKCTQKLYPEYSLKLIENNPSRLKELVPCTLIHRQLENS